MWTDCIGFGNRVALHGCVANKGEFVTEQNFNQVKEKEKALAQQTQWESQQDHALSSSSIILSQTMQPLNIGSSLSLSLSLHNIRIFHERNVMVSSLLFKHPIHRLDTHDLSGAIIYNIWWICFIK